MKVIIASTKTQGQRKNDFSHTDEGELLLFMGMECDRGTVDDNCGCKRALSGINSHKASTTGEVAEMDLDDATIRAMILKSLTDAGWLKDGEPDEFGLLDGTVADFMTLAGFASRLPVGTPIERRGTILRQRVEGARPAPRRRRSA